MGYDFRAGDNTFHWSVDNYYRLIDLMKRNGSGWSVDLSDIDMIAPLFAEEIVASLYDVVDTFASTLPDLCVHKVDLGSFTEVREDSIVDISNNVWLVPDPCDETSAPYIIREHDPRWMGLYFHHVIEFITFLAEARRQEETVAVSH